MDLKPNRFKNAIARGELQLGVWSSLCSPIAAEILAQSRFDWVLFDAEHAPVEISGLLPLLQAAASGTSSPVVRPPWNDPVLIKRVLDIGVQTVLLPFVETSDEAREAVRSCRYPPNGRRGVAGATRASGYGRTPNYLRDCDAEICVLVQVETGEALARIDEIAATSGVDGVFIGPSDLSASLGHIGNPGHRDVQAAIAAAAKTIRASGKPSGILATSAEDAKRYIDFGYTFVACNTDIKLLTGAVDGLFAQINTDKSNA